MSLWKGTQLKWGTVGEGGREIGEGKGRGRSVYKQPGTRVDRGSHHTHWRDSKKRDSGTGESSPGKGGIIKGKYQGDLSRGCAMCSHILSTLYISCYCVYVDNKRIVFRL